MSDSRHRAELLRRDELERQSVRYRQGVVTGTSPLAVALGGSDFSYTGVSALASAGPLNTGDVVAVLTFGNDLLVLDRIA